MISNSPDLFWARFCSFKSFASDKFIFVLPVDVKTASPGVPSSGVVASMFTSVISISNIVTTVSSSVTISSSAVYSSISSSFAISSVSILLASSSSLK